MRLSNKNAIYQAIIHGKWLDISYVNRKNEATNYYIGIKDIDISNDRLYCDVFNPFKSREIIKEDRDIYINISRIKQADILEQSYYDTPKELLIKIAKEKPIGEYLEIVNFDNNILKYLSDCYHLDNDPFLKETIMIDGIDTRLLAEDKYQLDDHQFDVLLTKVFKEQRDKAEISNRYKELAINKFSIDINNKQYVVAYRNLTLNFKDKSLRMSLKSSINKSFLIEGRKISLGMYLDMDPDYFCANFDSHEREFIESIKNNFRNNEIVNTRPNIYFLERDFNQGIDMALEAIHQMDLENKLTIPLKAFFGRKRSKNTIKKETSIVVFDKNKINIDQTRVIYNAMVNHVTYVKGPPGTGKTETIFNVLLSAYANEKTVLVCSNNNHPVNDIFSKMSQSFLTNDFYKEGSFPFPLIRLGNNAKMMKAMHRLKEVLLFVKKNESVNAKEEWTNRSKKLSLNGFEELKQLLIEYENQIELNERILTLEKIKKLTSIPQIETKLEKQIGDYKERLDHSIKIKDEDVLKYATSASKDVNFKNYLYYSSLLRFKKLLSEPYKELRGIIEKENIEEGARELGKYLKNDLSLKKFLAVFPLVVCTNLSCEKLGYPKPQFDLLIMDEAGQCNIASSLIPLVRTNSLLLVGDTNQLQPVTVIEETLNESLMKKYGIKEEYDYIHNSILSSMLRKDNNSKNILLRYHYRCGKRIASFVNQRFYDDELKLLNKNEGSLLYYDVKNTNNPNARNSYSEEALQIARIVKENRYQDVSIITPFVNQAALINDYLSRMGVNEVKAGTVHTLQGSEKSVIIMSSALSLKTSKKTMDWIKNNHELINVAVTRAKEKFIFVGDKTAIDTLSRNENSDIKVLSDYVASNGTIIVPKSETVLTYDFSNDSLSEKAFFDTIQPYFNRRGSKFKIERNVPVIEAIKGVHPEDLKLIGKKEFDVIVRVSEGFFNRRYRTIVAFEIDGGEHIGKKMTAMLDREKEEICKAYGVKLIRIPNSVVKDYESIISLFEFVVKDLPNIDEAYNQMTLFED